MMSNKSPTQDRLEDLLTYRLHIVKKLTDKIIHDEFLAHTGLSLPEARVMLCVGTCGQLSVSELGQKSNLDRSQASRAADGLVRRGLLAKASSELDARGVEIRLSEAGNAVFLRALSVSQQRNAAFLALLEPAQAEALMSALENLTLALQGLNGSVS
jgi:DNA-binding MarR family transcriptional regulator